MSWTLYKPKQQSQVQKPAVPSPVITRSAIVHLEECAIGRHEPFGYAEAKWPAPPAIPSAKPVWGLNFTKPPQFQASRNEAPSPTTTDVTEVLPPGIPSTHEVNTKAAHCAMLPEDHPLHTQLFPSLFKLRHVADAPDLFPFQRIAMSQIYRTIAIQQNNGLLIAPTGSGKTFIYGHAIEMLRYHQPKRFGNGKVILVVTKPSIIIQTQRVIQQTFRHRDVWVTSYDQLRSTLGDIFIDWVDKVLENGDIVKWPIWSDYAQELFGLIIFDECQSFKNEGSIQTRIGLSLANTKIPVLLGSATPYSRPMHVRATVALVKPYYSHGGSVRVTNRSYPAWLSEMCGSKDPADWSPSSMRRIQESIEPFTIRIGKVKYKHKTIIKQVMVDFSSPIKQKMYDDAFDEYQEHLIKYGKNPLEGFAAVLVAQLKFRQKSELLRADDMADLAADLVKKGKSVIVATAFNDTLRVIRTCLIKHHGYTEDNISIIMGGQGSADRQRNIDSFQNESNKIMLLMFQAGGAGLSLHQYEGCNRRPRHAILPPVWNAEEMVQVLGRAHRCNSDSTTHQWVVWYRGTIEEAVAGKLKRKLASMKEVVRTRETWVDLYANAATHGGVTIDISDKLSAPIGDIEKTKDDDDDQSVDADFDIEGEE